jgi:hypothetical protein
MKDFHTLKETRYYKYYLHTLTLRTSFILSNVDYALRVILTITEIISTSIIT